MLCFALALAMGLGPGRVCTDFNLHMRKEKLSTAAHFRITIRVIAVVLSLLKHPFTKEQARPSISGMQYRFHRAQVTAQHRFDASVHVLVQHTTSVRRWIQVVWATAPQTEPFPGAVSV